LLFFTIIWSVEASEVEFVVCLQAKGAGGDVRKGKLEPFAYMPLDPRDLNRRNVKNRRIMKFKIYIQIVVI
jgi:hypothetical protein